MNPVWNVIWIQSSSYLWRKINIIYKYCSQIAFLPAPLAHTESASFCQGGIKQCHPYCKFCLAFFSPPTRPKCISFLSYMSCSGFSRMCVEEEMAGCVWGCFWIRLAFELVDSVCPPCCEWASSDLFKAWTEQKAEGGGIPPCVSYLIAWHLISPSLALTPGLKPSSSQMLRLLYLDWTTPPAFLGL